MRSYYALSVQFRYYGPLPEFTEVRSGHVFATLGNRVADVTRWKNPPHEWLANRSTHERNDDGALIPASSGGLVDPKAVAIFVKTYGALFGAPAETNREFWEDTARFAAAIERVRSAWRGDESAIKEMEEQVESALELSPSITAQGIELVSENLWSFTCALFLRDRSLGKTKICASASCKNPYFLERRKGQIFCSHVCAVRENVRRFRQSAAGGADPERKKLMHSKRVRRPNHHGAGKTR